MTPLNPYDPTTFPAEVHLTRAQSDALWYMPQALGGRLVPLEIQEQMAAAGLLVMAPDGRYAPTVFGDVVRLGRIRQVLVD